jgi:hypothetical protein
VSIDDVRVRSWLLSSSATFCVVLWLVTTDPDLIHWMVIPTAIAGTLIGVDAAAWVLKGYDAMDPRGLIGLFGYHFFFLVPLLHVKWDYWPQYVAPAEDWRQSLGMLAVINMVGLLIYRFGISLRVHTERPPRRRVDKDAFLRWLVPAVLVSLLASMVTVARFGGVQAYWQVITESRDSLEGAGYLLLIAEAWPLLLFAGIVVAKSTWLRDHRWFLLGLIVAFVVAQLLAGGLRGSRSNTIWPALIALGIVHHLVRPFRRWALVFAGVVLVSFMYIYGLYKGAGTEVTSVLSGEVEAGVLAEETGRTTETVVLEDLGRAGIQAIVIDRQRTLDGPRPANGEGYVGDVLKFLPDEWMGGTRDKVALGTQTLYGMDAFEQQQRSSRIYGLVGEGVLNFGIFFAALPFLAWTLYVRYATRVHLRAARHAGLGPKLLAPVLSITAILMMGSDLDNVIWFLAKQALPLAFVVWLSLDRTRSARNARLIRQRHVV